jgi:hypothetical protein
VTERKSQSFGHTGKDLDFSAGLFEPHHRHDMRDCFYEDFASQEEAIVFAA